MESIKPRDGLKRLVLQELESLGLQNMVGEVIREAVADLVHSNLAGLAGSDRAIGSVQPVVPFANKPPATILKGAVESPENPSSGVTQEDAGTVSPEELVRDSNNPARYIYGVVEGRENVLFGPIGIEEADVYTVAYDGLLAIVHDCSPEPYESKDEEQVKKWLFTQQKVLDMANEKFGTVLPMGFNTIIQTEGQHPSQTVRRWLTEESTKLRGIFARVRGRDEYGIQVFVDDETLKRSALDEDPEFKKLKKEVESKPEGVRYMYRQRLENVAKEALEGLAERCFREVYEAISAVSDDVQVEKVKKPEDGLRMVVNLSCLVPKEKVEDLGRILAEINSREGFLVRFTGPWPPYSFMKTLAVADGEGISA
ncbi:GvpL/GvpF family gas vesicle protein [Candidatus Desulforudis audaxviator]|uniref:GvpL/GvpF family gas vesicle protein n=1 Tax=Candidatus Desulforudis audaxviator TaxID=471827 RepID=UPI00107D4EF4|nr:GvpL/GvpF family gas vesicle protein [Candidatus Desulforudis audaxviator]AZK60008.1 Gas vesicle synthesis protein GvpL/GvpF [Candidatus Desulforudis audaxviator]